MPTYDYQCDNCSHLFEYFQSMSDEPLRTCPDCGQDSLRRLIGGGMGIIFKGSGFYVNDAKKSASTSAPLKEKNGKRKEGSNSAENSSKSDSTKAAGSAGAKGGQTKSSS